MDWTVIGTFAAGLGLLVAGAECLVRGASRLALAAGVTPLVVGLTVVAYGTSSPELAVSAESALRGQADVAIGNVLGSNIFNVLFILGLSALVTPLAVHQRLLRVDVPVMIGTTMLLVLLVGDGRVDRLEGVVLLAGLVGYTAFSVIASRRESKAVQGEYEEAFGGAEARRSRSAPNVLLVLAGLALLVLGARWLTDSSVSMARSLGVSDLVIGLTIVAAGTSMPELATTLLAAWRGERDIAVGNVVGSNVFNVLGVLGASAVFAPGGVPVAAAASSFDLPVALAVSFACLPVFFTGGSIERWEGLLFLLGYGAYVVYLVLDGTGHAATPVYSGVMLSFVLPVVALTLLVLGLRDAARRSR